MDAASTAICARSTNGGDSSIDFTGATVSSRRNWLTPLQFDPANPAVLYYAGNQVNRSVDHAVHWSVISPDLTGGPGRDPSYPFGTVTTVAGAKTDPNRVFAGTDDGRLWFTTNLGGNWTQVTDPDVPGTWVTRVTVDPVNAQVAYATFSGFRSGVGVALRAKDDRRRDDVVEHRRQSSPGPGERHRRGGFDALRGHRRRRVQFGQRRTKVAHRRDEACRTSR